MKTGLLAGEPFWELPDDELVRRCAAFKAAVCLRDPLDAGERAILNLGHTFAHALEAAAGFQHVTHGDAVALGLLAALRLSGRDTAPVRGDPAPASRSASTATAPGRRCSATRRTSAARSGSSSSATTGRAGRRGPGRRRPPRARRADRG